MLLRSYSENRNKKFQIQGGGYAPPWICQGGVNAPPRLSVHNHMVGRAASVESPFYSILLAADLNWPWNACILRILSRLCYLVLQSRNNLKFQENLTQNLFDGVETRLKFIKFGLLTVDPNILLLSPSLNH